MVRSGGPIKPLIKDLSNAERQAVRRIYQQIIGTQDLPSLSKSGPLLTRALREWNRTCPPVDYPEAPRPTTPHQAGRHIGYYISAENGKRCFLYGIPVRKGDCDIDLLEVDAGGQTPDQKGIRYLPGLEDPRIRIVKVTGELDKREVRRAHEFNMQHGVAVLQRFVTGEKDLDTTAGFLKPDLFANTWDRRLELARRKILEIVSQEDYEPMTTEELVKSV
ncbi:hypothetical protein LIA77_11861 [Sarocladium implicatum]|nr:hypothetical protein LIA77_11861 [Sarocladium implicatum]